MEWFWVPRVSVSGAGFPLTLLESTRERETVIVRER
jgi:hypothetical protein